MSVRLALIAAGLTLGVANVEAAPIFGSTYLRTVETVGLGGCGPSSAPRPVPKHLPPPSWAREAPSNNLTACSNEQQTNDTGSDAHGNSDQSGSTDPQGGAGNDAHSNDQPGSTGPQGGAGEQNGGAGEQSGSEILQLPLDIDYDSTPDGQGEDLFADIEVVVDREVVTVPEPGTLVLLVTGLLGGLLVRRRQR